MTALFGDDAIQHPQSILQGVFQERPSIAVNDIKDDDYDKCMLAVDVILGRTLLATGACSIWVHVEWLI